MRNRDPLLQQQSRSVEIATAIGQIDLIGESGEIVKSWRIRSPKCTIGSSLDCSVQLTSSGVAPLHATLIFGRKHTLLRSAGPTLISNRHVREWLIDHSTEIVIGQSRLVVHPTLGVLATVVHAESLIDQAARLCKELTPSIPEPTKSIVQEPKVQQPNTSMNSVDSSIDSPPPPAVSSKLDSIERLLQSLQVSLDKMQASIGTETKNANESIVESVSHGIDEFGKRLFTTLNDQLNSQTGVHQSLIIDLADRFTDRLGAIDDHLHNQTGVQQSLIANLADRFTDRFGAIDDQLSRFNDATSQQANSLSELLAQANLEQEFIEARFQEVICHRNELIDAVQVLRSEIAIAFQTPNNPIHQSAFACEPQSIATQFEREYASESETNNSVTNDQLADSLERAQIQIHELNQQLRALETERDSAQQRVATLSESWQSVQAATETSEQPIYAVAPNSNVTNSEDPYFETAVSENLDEDARQVTARKGIKLPAWFTIDEPDVSSVDSVEQLAGQIKTSTPVEPDQQFAAFSTPDLGSYSDAGYDPEPFEASDQLVHTSDENIDSVSDRLQRMLMDADQRRGSANPPTSLSWSEKYNNSSADSDQARKLNRLQHAFQAESVASDKRGYEESTENNEHESVPPSFSENQSGLADVSPSYDRSTQDESPKENSQGVDEEESIEQYMQRLLNRVRGGSENEVASAPSSAVQSSVQGSLVTSTRNNTRPRLEASKSPDPDDTAAQPADPRRDEELFVPRQQAQEQRNDLTALRELANTNARRAINRSDIRRTNSAFFVKLGVTALAVSSAVALFLFNGFTLNAPFVGMVAAIIVSLLWGYDCINHFNRLKKAGGKNQVTAAETAAGQSIQVGSDEDSGWRPTSA